MSKSQITLQCNEDGDMAYLFLPEHPGRGTPGASAKQISLASVIPNYKGPEIFLDFDENGAIIGIELLLD